jgi:UDP-N-acetyl-D-glucosamine dehydrogenase
MGVTYKPDVSDVRESPALDIMHLLQEQGAHVSYHDPYVPTVRLGDHEWSGKSYSAALLKSMDAVIVTTPHATFDPKHVLRHSPLVIDTRNFARGLNAAHLVRI